MAEYFSHDYDTRSDEKIMDLMADTSWVGYGLFWGIVELLYQNGGTMRTQYKRIAYALGTEEDSVQRIIEDYDLFVVEGGNFWSESINKRLDERATKSEKARESANKRWKKQKGDANAMRTQCDSNAIKESKVKERIESKVKDSKEKKEEDLIFPFDSEDFLKWWLYWKTYKAKDHKFHYKSNISEQAALKELSGLANGDENTALKIIEQSIAKGWKGFFELKKDSKQYNNDPTARAAMREKIGKEFAKTWKR